MSIYIYIRNRMFRVLSYNVWFKDYKRMERTKELINRIKKNNPDLVCLQELIPETFEIIKTNLNDYKYVFPKQFTDVYGCAIFSKYEMLLNEEHEFTSLMGRKLLTTVINFKDHNVVICNTHFESEFGNKNVTKIGQFKKTKSILNKIKEYGPVILCADTNIMESDEKEFIVDKGWRDAWIENGSLIDKQHTYYYYKKGSRLDRIIYNGPKLINFYLIKSTDKSVEASDHFGVMSDFQIF